MAANWNGAHAWRRLPALLAFALLTFQIAIPWTIPHYTTQDGASHLYTGVVLRHLVFHPHGALAGLYRMQPAIVPNWTSDVLLGLAASVFGATRAEPLLVTICLLTGFVGFEYLSRALFPGAPAWSPIANFVLHNWFLWAGFYNFYLGVALCPLVVGYFIRHRHDLTIRSAGMLGLALLVLFFTHIIGAALAASAIAAIAAWGYLADPAYRALGFRGAARHFGLLCGAILPIAILAAFFVEGSSRGVHFQSEIARAWHEFPKGAFIVGPGRLAHEDLLWPPMLFLVLIAPLAMRRREWRGPKGGVAIAAGLTIALYFLAPDDGLGGQEVKKRLAWAVFVLGSPLVCTAVRLRPLRTPIAILVTLLLAGSILTSMRMSRAMAAAVGDYDSAMAVIPAGSTFLRVYYALPSVAPRYGFEGVPYAPLFHADAYAAATRGLIDLSDYQAASGLFPVVYGPKIDIAHRYGLWGLENSANDNPKILPWILETRPAPIDYVVIVGDDTAADQAKTGAALAGTMRSLPRTSAAPFVQVYERIGKK